MMNPRFNETFWQLVQSWESHEAASRSGNIAELADARTALDKARLESARARHLVG